MMVAFAHERAQRGGCCIENLDLMLVDDLPEAAVIGPVGHAFEHDGRGPVHERPVDDIAVPGDPADIGRAPIDLAGPVIEHVAMRPCGPDGIATRCMHYALGLAGRSAGIKDEQGVFGIDDGRRAVRRYRRACLVVPDVAPGLHCHVAARVPDDDDLLDPRGMGDRGIHIGLQRDGLAAAPPLIRGNHDA
jgi:hypothetical protein